MKLINDKLDYTGTSTGNFRICTGNSYITKEHKVVMGRGAALEVRDNFPSIDLIFANNITHLTDYSLIMNLGWRIGLFQVKYHFRDAADLGLIQNSTKALAEVARAFPQTTFDMNYPGIGNGKLQNKESIIQSMLEALPNNVHVFKCNG